jgi:hypothetical protein
MSQRATRRRFLQAAAVGSLSAFRSVPQAQSGETESTPESIRFGPDLEPIVRLIEETPREKCVAVLTAQLHAGLPYRRFLAAVFLAALRKQNSHHSVYLVHSAHEVSLDLSDQDRLLPLFWAVDHFKWHQQKFPTPALPLLTGPLAAPESAESELHEAMQRTDEERAERAVAALARSAGARQAFETFWQYGCRDVSLIGHRAIAVTNGWRTLETVGWQHAEPVLRFVVHNLLNSNGCPDRYYEPNVARVDKVLDILPVGWPAGYADRAATAEAFALLRQGQSERACELAVKQLAGGVGAQPLWDAIHIAASELLILHASDTGMAARPLHANTTANALHYAFNTCSVPRIRLLILLQEIAWIGDFVRSHLGDEMLSDIKPVDLGGSLPAARATEAVQDLFEQLPPRTYDLSSRTKGGYALVQRDARADLGRQVFALVNQDPAAAGLYMQAARKWLCAKAVVEAHEFKLPAAMFEDYSLVSPEWRPRLLAASAHWLHGKQSPDSQLLREAREEIQKL